MSQPPAGQLPPWERPQRQHEDTLPADPSPDLTAQHAAQRYGQPQYGQPQYGQPQYGQPQYGQPLYPPPQYGQPQYGQPPYGQYPYPPPQYGQFPYGQPPYPAYGYAGQAPRRNRRRVLLWCAAGAALLVAAVVVVVTAVSAAAPDTVVVPAPAATWAATGLGDDPVFDRLAQDCHDGGMSACDDLFDQSDVGSAYEQYGDTCAGRRPAGEWPYCTDVFSDSGGSSD